MNANLFPSIFDFDPSDSNFHCIAHTKYADKRRCRNTLGTTRAQAQQLKTELMETKRRDFAKVDLILRNYVLMCCCTRWHRGMVAESNCIDLLVHRWKKEIMMEYTFMNMKCESSTGFTGRNQGHGIKVEEPLSTKYQLPIKQRQLPTITSSIGQTSPQYNLRSCTLQDSSSSNDKCPTATWVPPHKFIPYRSSLEYDALRDEILEPLGPRSLATGSLYLYTRSCDPGYVKIGYTTETVSQRMAKWRSDCHYDPIVRHSIADVPNVRRAERLVHIVIAEHRRRETTCKTNPSCSKSHMEWFEIDLKAAVQIMNKVAKFMQTERPYGSGATLTQTWRNLVVDFDGELTLDDLLACRRPSFSSITPIIQEPDEEEKDEETTLLCTDDEEPTLLCEEVEVEDKDRDPTTTKEDPIDPIDPIKAAKTLITSEINESSSSSSSNPTTTTTTSKPTINQNDNKLDIVSVVNNTTMTAEAKAVMTQLLNLLKQAENALAASRLMLENQNVWSGGGGGDCSPVIGLVRSETIDLTVAA